MTGFTPGPWEPRRAHKPDNCGGYDWAIVAPEKAIIAECFQVVDYATQGHGFNMQPVEANAHLIAAAPELFEALDDFDNWFCGFNPECQASRMEGRKVIIRARAALAKAKGETQ